MVIKMVNRTINLELYKLTQDEIFEYLQNYLKKLNVKFEIFEDQIISINYPNQPIFVAHMDTVQDKDMKKLLIIKENIIRRQNGILGADDRAGVNIILNHCKNLNFIFTRDEEIGCLGVKKLVDVVEEYVEKFENSCFIELDRKGGNSLLASNHGYCEEDLTDDITKIAPFLINDFGAYTDIDHLIHILPAVNLSIGYYNGHCKEEYLNIDEYNVINSLINDLNKELTGKKYKIPEPKFKEFYYDYYRDTNYEICDECESIYEVDELYIDLEDNTLKCIDCLEKIYNKFVEDLLNENKIIRYLGDDNVEYELCEECLIINENQYLYIDLEDNKVKCSYCIKNKYNSTIVELLHDNIILKW
jgi:hypothetical protein